VRELGGRGSVSYPGYRTHNRFAAGMLRLHMLDRQVWAFRRGGLRHARQQAFGDMEERVGCADAVERR
jgi:hypothetical protein